MLHYPEINPIALQIGPLRIYWYGLMYLMAFSTAWLLARFKAKKPNSPLSTEAVNDLIFYSAMGVVIGGRLGYMLFYDSWQLFSNPLVLLKVWQGGMSFHGGLLGVVSALYLYSRQSKINFFRLTDFIAPLVPIGLALGRLGNFINGELWGRITNVPWGMVFPHIDSFPRHPSQLYELFFEGFMLFFILWFYAAKEPPTRAVSSLFVLLYGVIRFFIEFFRQPDPQLGFIAFGWLTMGQLLSIPMILIGGFVLFQSYRQQERINAAIS